jgi:hypothetical protein
MSFTDGFVPIPTNDLNQLKRVNATALLLRDSVRVRVSWYEGRETKIRMVRFENSSCRDECITALFLNEYSDAALSSLMFLPPVLARGDVAAGVCESCETDWPLVFRAANGRYTAVLVWKGKVVYHTSQEQR